MEGRLAVVAPACRTPTAETRRTPNAEAVPARHHAPSRRTVRTVLATAPRMETRKPLETRHRQRPVDHRWDDRCALLRTDHRDGQFLVCSGIVSNDHPPHLD